MTGEAEEKSARLQDAKSCRRRREGAASRPVIECEGIRFSYRKGEEILRGLGFSVAAGERVAICGPNGSGKTTLLKLLAGILRPEAGTVSVCGRPSGAESFRKLGIVFQDPNDQLFCGHVYDDVAYGLVNLGLPKDAIRPRVEEALELMEAAHLIARPIHHLSLGEMKRVALAGVIAMRPEVILMDEPTAGLDPAATEHLIELMTRLSGDTGRTLISISQEMDILPRIADRVLILCAGRIISDRSVRATLTDMSLLAEARLEPPEITRYFLEMMTRTGGGDPMTAPLSVEEALTLPK